MVGNSLEGLASGGVRHVCCPSLSSPHWLLLLSAQVRALWSGRGNRRGSDVTQESATSSSMATPVAFSAQNLAQFHHLRREANSLSRRELKPACGRMPWKNSDGSTGGSLQLSHPLHGPASDIVRQTSADLEEAKDVLAAVLPGDPDKQLEVQREAFAQLEVQHQGKMIAQFEVQQQRKMMDAFELAHQEKLMKQIKAEQKESQGHSGLQKFPPASLGVPCFSRRAMQGNMGSQTSSKEGTLAGAGVLAEFEPPPEEFPQNQEVNEIVAVGVDAAEIPDSAGLQGGPTKVHVPVEGICDFCHHAMQLSMHGGKENREGSKKSKPRRWNRSQKSNISTCSFNDPRTWLGDPRE